MANAVSHDQNFKNLILDWFLARGTPLALPG